MENNGMSNNGGMMNKCFSEQKEINGIKEKKEYFARFPKWYFECGMIKNITGTELKVLCILLDKAGWADREGKIINPQLISESGISKGNNIKNIIDKLEMTGIIETTWSQGRKRYYKIIHREPQDITTRFSNVKKQREEKNDQDKYDQDKYDCI